MINLKNEITNLIADNISIQKDMIYQNISLIKEKDKGDYTFPCFTLSKQLKKSPNQISEELKEKLKLPKFIEKVESVNGYLNFYIDKEYLTKEVFKEYDLKGQDYGKSDIGTNKTVLIDYSSPNIAKPFHIGHLRSTVIGGSLYKIYKFLGYNTIGINYLGDWGLQFGKVIAGISLWKDEYDFKNDEMGSILKIYIRFNKEEKDNPELTEMARKNFKKLEAGDEETVKEWEHIRKISLENYEKIYQLLDSKFDSYNGESYYNDKMGPIVEELDKKGLLKESQGAKVVDLEEYNMPPCIIITSAGTTIYATRDLASLKDRINKYNFDKAIYVVGNEQQLHFKQVFKVLELMGYEEYASRCVHVPFGLVIDKHGEKIGTRKGNSVFLEDILNESITKAKEIIEEKNPNLDNSDDVAQKVGIGAVIFSDLYNSRIKDEVFDLDEMLSFQGETCPYIQYMYVRIKSIIEKSNENVLIKDINYSKLNDELSYNIVKLLYNFTDVVIQASNKNEPYIVSRYLIDLAQAYSLFYNQNKVLSDDIEERKARLYLINMVGSVLKTGCGLLGIKMPDKM